MFKYKEFRRAHSLFQSQLAEIIGMTQSNISRYETEGIEPTREQYEKLYEKYGKDDVNAFIVDESLNVSASNNIMKGTGVQNNGIQADRDMLAIIKKQAETMASHVERQDALNERLVALLEKVTIR